MTSLRATYRFWRKDIGCGVVGSTFMVILRLIYGDPQ